MHATATETSYVDSGGVRLYTESSGTGTPILFLHELAGDARNWQPQVDHLADRYRCVRYNARGYPPSDVPEDPAQYSVEHVVNDAVAVIRHFGFDNAHVIGLSMGGHAALTLAIEHPELVRSVVAAGTGHGSDPDTRQEFLTKTAQLADGVLESGLEVGGHGYLHGPWRRRFPENDADGFARFNRQFTEHSALGMALTIRGYQLRRPTLQELAPKLANLSAPVLIVTGDDDEPCVVAGMFLKKTLPDARLCVIPRATHGVNLERPEAFNMIVSEFIIGVDRQIEEVG